VLFVVLLHLDCSYYTAFLLGIILIKYRVNRSGAETENERTFSLSIRWNTA